MLQATPGQARVVDPILSAVARGYRSPKASIANILFPLVTVGQRAGRVIAFGADDFIVKVTGVTGTLDVTDII